MSWLRWASTTACALAVVSIGCRGSEPSSSGAGGGGSGGLGTAGEAAGGNTGGGGSGGAGGSGSADLGWPLDDSLPERCVVASSPGGSAWQGWGNLQHPPAITVAAGDTTEAIYGRVYHAGETPGVGQAPGWEAELGVGPLGTLPTGEGRCWSFGAASFNVDVGNDDEYAATITAAAPGLWSYLYRFRPVGGAWLYGDLNGSDDDITVEQAGSLVVADPATTAAPLVVVSLNLRCRLDDWPARQPLVVQALARVDPDLIAFQEDCVQDGGPSQAEEIRAALATYSHRGYALVRAGTHQADSGGKVYEEGISLLSAHPLEASATLDLPYEQLPRKALAVDVVVRGQPLRFYATHLDFGDAAESARQQAAATIVADIPPGSAAIVAGDLNADPAEPAIATLEAALTDLWTRANPTSAGHTFPSDAPTVRIDYLFASAALGEAIVGAKLLDEASGGTLLSDHLGVAVALLVPE